MKKAKPPAGKKDRQNWDATQHWKRKFAKRITFDEIIPEHIQQYRRFMVQEFKKNGFMPAKVLRDELVEWFENGMRDGKITQTEINWVKENLDSLLAVMKKERLKKLKQK